MTYVEERNPHCFINPLGPSLRRRASLRSSEVGLYFVEFGSTYNTVKLWHMAVRLKMSSHTSSHDNLLKKHKTMPCSRQTTINTHGKHNNIMGHGRQTLCRVPNLVCRVFWPHSRLLLFSSSVWRVSFLL
jgi:hypothetical protein